MQPFPSSPSGLGGALPKIRDGYVRPHLAPISNLLSLNDPLLIFHILLSPNYPHFQNALSLNVTCECPPPPRSSAGRPTLVLWDPRHGGSRHKTYVQVLLEKMIRPILDHLIHLRTSQKLISNGGSHGGTLNFFVGVYHTVSKSRV